MNWLRRNVLAVLLLPLLVVGLAAPEWDDLYGRYWRNQPHQVSTATRGHPATMDKITVTLRSVEPVDLEDPYTHKAVELPKGVRFWKVVLNFTVQGDEDFVCDVTVIDRKSRTYSTDVNELSITPFSSRGCFPPSLAKDHHAFDNDNYFLLPQDAQPLEVRVIMHAHTEPRYIRLIVDT